MKFEPIRAATLPSPKKAAQLSWPVQLTAIVALSFYLHSVCWWTEPRDLSLFLGPWFDHIVRYGPVNAFAHPFSNYTPAYLYLLAAASLAHSLLPAMYIIKLMSVAGTVFLALSLGDLLKVTGGQAKHAVLVFLLPSVILNSALLAQCDALWAGACIYAVAAMIRGLTVRSLVWCGVAIAFKAQAAFIAPFILGGLIGRRAPLWQWAIPPAVFVASLLPAVAMGWPLSELLLVYPRQTGWFDWPGRLANPWFAATMFADGSAQPYYWIGYAAAGGAAVAVATLAARSVYKPATMMALAALCATALPFLMPKMLERYYFLADVLALALALSSRTRPALLSAIAIQGASFLSLLTYMYWYGRPWPTLVGAGGATIALAAMWVTFRQAKSGLTENKPRPIYWGDKIDLEA
jgi:Gpi18-like mannosyltransferase